MKGSSRSTCESFPMSNKPNRMNRPAGLAVFFRGSSRREEAQIPTKKLTVLGRTLVFQNPVRGEMFIECPGIQHFLFVFQRGFGRNGTKPGGSICRSRAHRRYRCYRAENKKEAMAGLLVSINMSPLRGFSQ